MNRRLNEDADRYCMFWIGVVMMTAYFVEFIFKMTTGSAAFETSNLAFLLGGPILLSVLLLGYFVPDRGKMKNLFLSIASFVSVMFIILTLVSFQWDVADTIWYASWGIGSAIVASGGAAMLKMTRDDEAYTEGIMDVSKLHYGPVAPDVEFELEATTVETEKE